MEEVLVVIIQIFFEVFVQFLGSAGTDISLGKKADQSCGIIFLHALLGGGLGWISTLIAPKLIIPIVGLRIVNLLVSPLIAGSISWLVARNFTKQDASAAFLHGSLFALMFGLARFAFGTR